MECSHHQSDQRPDRNRSGATLKERLDVLGAEVAVVEVLFDIAPRDPLEQPIEGERRGHAEADLLSADAPKE